MPHIAPPPLIAQAPTSPTLQRLQQLEQADRAARAAEAKNWRTFPIGANPVPAPGQPLPFMPPLETGPAETCSYYWPGWKLDPSTGIRHTQMRCKRSLLPYVAVNCSTLQVATGGLPTPPPSAAPFARSYQRWYHWRLPANLGQEQLVAALCDNI